LRADPVPGRPAARLPHRGGRQAVFAGQLDCADQATFLEIGKRHKIPGIVHLAAAGLGELDPIENLHANTQGLLNALRAAKEWAVPPIGIASTIGVYRACARLRSTKISRSR
jgi:UDP-glucose 4-epimerase